MRFIIREQDSERLLAAGLFQYTHNGQSTGVTEEWRLTEVMDHYRVLRSDLDERKGNSGQSTLYHLIINPDRGPERLKMMLLSPASPGWVDVLLEDNSLSISQNIDGRRWEEEYRRLDNDGFLYPSAAWLGYWAALNQSRPPESVHYLNKNGKFGLEEIDVDLQKHGGGYIDVGSDRIMADLCSLDLPEGKRSIWIDRYGLAVKAELDKDITAVETRYIRQM